MTTNPNLPRNWRVDRASTQVARGDLPRSECMPADPDGTLWTADSPRHVVQVTADSRQTSIGQQNGSTAGCTVPAMIVTSGTGTIGLMLRTLPSELDHWDCDAPVWTHYRQQQC